MCSKFGRDDFEIFWQRISSNLWIIDVNFILSFENCSTFAVHSSKIGFDSLLCTSKS
jgi:hypothetical protein